MSCKKNRAYTIHIKHNRDLLKYRIDTPKNPENNSFSQKCAELGWSDPLKDTQIKKFINTDMNSNKCFTSDKKGNHNIKTFYTGDNKCIVSKSCKNGEKHIDYTCLNVHYNDNSLIALKRDTAIQLKAASGKNLNTQAVTLLPGHTIDNVFMNKQLDFTKTRGYLRCKQGYVAKHIGPKQKGEKITLKATVGWKKNTDGSLWWVYEQDKNEPDKNEIPTYHDWSGECVPDKCEDRTIPDSNHTYDPLHGSHTDKPIKVRCNDGYMFNHDLLHQGGYVKCDYELMNKTDKLEDRNKMKWFIHDDRLENKCNQFKDENSCEGKNGFPVPTYDPYEFLDTVSMERKMSLYNIQKDTMKGYDKIPIGCKWSPPKSGSKGISNKPGSCHFRKEVNYHKDEPICKPIYCPEKIVPHSNRNGIGSNNPLPGPKQGKTKGECITNTGEILSDITNPQDCLCQQHMSCNTCTNDKNCQWCGSGKKPGCYYVHTNDPKCSKNPIRQHAGGSCTSSGGERKPGWDKLSKADQNISNCEKDYQCINKNTAQPIPQNIIKSNPSLLSMETISNNYQINTKTQPPKGRELCLSYNNQWVNQSVNTYSSNDDYCYFDKVITNQYNSPINLIPIGLWAGDSEKMNTIKYVTNPKNNYGTYLATTPYYCKSMDNPSNTIKFDSKRECIKQTSVNTCDKAKGCIWTKNELSDDKINWNYYQKNPNKHNDIVKIGPLDSSNSKCYFYDKPLPNRKNHRPTLLGSEWSSVWGNDGNAQKPAYNINNKSSTDLLFYVEKVDNNSAQLIPINPIKTKTGIYKGAIHIHPSAMKDCGIQYIDNLTNGKNNAFNIPENLLTNIGGLPLKRKEAISCIDGLKYCNPKKGKDNCGPNNPVFSHNLIQGESKGRNDGKICQLTEDDSHCETIGCKRGTTYGKGNIIQDTEVPTNNEFISLSHKPIYNKISGRENICNTTDNIFQKINQPKFIKDNEKKFNKEIFGSCKLPHSLIDYSLNKKRCEILNKRINNKDTVHWGNYCTKKDEKGKDVFIPVKNVCENTGGKWQDVYTTDKITGKTKIWKKGCVKLNTKTKEEYKQDNDVCKNITDYTVKDDPKCIISVPSNIPSPQMKAICEQWDVSTINPDIKSDNKFTYTKKADDILNTYNINRKGACLLGKGRNLKKNTNIGRTSKLECEQDNNEYDQAYTYSNTSFCKLSDITNTNDKKLTWTGGELKSDGKDTWSDECSSSILSSCQVACEPGYGGGGIYTCHYNTHSDDVCKHVEDTFKSITIEKTQRDNCEINPNCEYKKKKPLTESKCILRKTSENDDMAIKGQAEWLGNECYPLNNDAFAHGIYNLPTLNEAFPPLIRLIAFFVIIILLLFILKIAGVYRFLAKKTLNASKSIGEHTYKGLIAIILDLTMGIVDFVKVSAKVIKGDVKFYSFAAYSGIINIKKILLVLLVLVLLFILNIYTNFVDFIRKGYNSQYVSIEEKVVKQLEKDEQKQTDLKEFIDRFFIVFVIAGITILYYILYLKTDSIII